ncbi:hypothetical protein M3J09_006269 [Ascochyta lentis]
MTACDSVLNALADDMANIQTSLNSGPNARQLQSRLEELARRQEELQESREEALINREVLSESRQHMREQRARTAEVEVALMNAFRQHYNQISQSIPKELTLAYRAVDEQRNKLGCLEDEYLQAEEEQGALEWNLTDLETELYQYRLRNIFTESDLEEHSFSAPEDHIAAPKPPEPMSPSTAIQYQMATTELEGLAHRYMKLRQQISDRLISATNLSVEDVDLTDLGSTEFVQSFLELLDKITNAKVRIQHLKAIMIQHGSAPRASPCSFSEPTFRSKDIIGLETVPRARSDGSISELEDSTFIVHHIRDWLVECLRENAVQRVQYLSTLHDALNYMELLLPDVTQWETLVRQHWISDETEHLAGSISVVRSAVERHDQSIQDNNSHNTLSRYRLDESSVTQHSPIMGLDNTALLYGLTSPLASWTECSVTDSLPPSIDLTKEKTVDVEMETGQRNDFDIATATHNVNYRQTPGLISSVSQVRTMDTRMERCDSAHDWNPARVSRTASPFMLSEVIDERTQLHMSEVTDPVQRKLEVIDASIMTPGLTYSDWTWSAELQRDFCYGFELDGTVIEVLWLENSVSDRMGEPAASDALPYPSQHTLQPVDQTNDFNHTAVPFEPLAYSWADFCLDNNNSYSTRFQYIAAEYQDEFYVKGRVFNMLLAQGRNISSEDVSDHLRTAKTSQHCLYEIRRFLVIRNKQTFSQCM